MKRIATIVATLFFAAQIYGQSLPFLNISSDPVAQSMGGVSLTLATTPMSVSGNASMLVHADGMLGVSASHTLWQPELQGNNLSSVSGYGKIGDKLAVGIAGKYFSYLPYDVVSDVGYISGTFTPVEYSAEAAVAYRIIAGLSVGVNVRYISSSMAEEMSGSAIGADLSATYKLGNLKVAAAVTNIGSDVKYGENPYKLPAMAKVGAGYVLNVAKTHSIGLHVEGDYLLYQSAFMAGIGAEYSFKDLLSVRGGYHLGSNGVVPSYASVGAGVQFAGFALNAFYLIGLHNTFGFSLAFSL